MSDVEDRLRTVENQLAKEEGSRKTARIWAVAFGTLIIGWLGVTTFYQIPKTVSKWLKEKQVTQMMTNIESSVEKANDSVEELKKKEGIAEDIVKELKGKGYVAVGQALIYSSSKGKLEKAESGNPGTDYTTCTCSLSFFNPGSCGRGPSGEPNAPASYGTPSNGFSCKYEPKDGKIYGTLGWTNQTGCHTLGVSWVCIKL